MYDSMAGTISQKKLGVAFSKDLEKTNGYVLMRITFVLLKILLSMISGRWVMKRMTNGLRS